MAKSKTKTNFWEKYGLAIIVGVLFIAFIVIYKVIPDAPKTVNKCDSPKTIQEVTVDDWVKMTKENKYVVTTLGQTTCSYCVQFRPVVEDIAKEGCANYVWFDIDKFSEEQVATLTGTYNIKSDFGTPYTFVTHKGKLKGDLEGYSELSSLKSSLAGYGVSKSNG